MSDNVIVVTDANFEQEVLKSDQTVLVDFWAPWCGPCKMVGPIVSQLADEYAGKAKICKVNVDENNATAMQYRVMSIPTLILFKNGEEVNRIIGFRPKQDLAKMLDS